MKPAVSLRALEPEDLELVYALENTPDVAEESADTAPLSRYAVRRYLEQQPAAPYVTGEMRLVIMADGLPDGQGNFSARMAAGLVDLTAIDLRHGHAEVGVAVLPALRHKGVATAALVSLEGVALRLGIRTLTAHIAVGNVASLTLFEHGGYLLAGTLPRYRTTRTGPQDVRIYYKTIGWGFI